MDPKDFVFIDEAGSQTNVTIEYARAKGQTRVKMGKPGCRWEHFSMIGAISIFGIIAITYGKWATNSLTFLSFVKDFLIKKLRRGQMIFMDNVPFHKLDKIRELIESVGAKLVFLPPYSPDLSPIEKMWSKLKHFIKKFGPNRRVNFIMR